MSEEQRDAPGPLVTAIVVNWNGGARLEDALASLFAQSWPRLQVVLVDNGSRDGSADAAAARYGDRLQLIRNRRNEGFAKGNNQGFAVAAGEWVFLLNNDAVADPDAVQRLMEFARDRPEVGMLACRVHRHSEEHVIDSTGLLFYPDGTCRPRGWQEKDLGQYDQPDEVLAPHGCAGAYRVAMLAETGPFDAEYFAYLEDLDLGMRGQLLGWKCWYVPSARVRHHKSATAGNYSRFKAYHVERNRVWNAVKLLPPFLLLMSPLFTLNRYLMQAYAAASRRGLSDDFVREYSWFGALWIVAKANLAALWGLPRMLGRRRQLTSRRRLTTQQWYELISRFKLDAIELALKH